MQENNLHVSVRKSTKTYSVNSKERGANAILNFLEQDFSYHSSLA
jgi:hypothetical protein